MALITVTNVESLPKARLHVKLSNGRTVEVDVTGYLSAPGYERLRKPAFFARATVAEWGHGVNWPGDIGIPVEALIIETVPSDSRSIRAVSATRG